MIIIYLSIKSVFVSLSPVTSLVQLLPLKVLLTIDTYAKS